MNWLWLVLASVSFAGSALALAATVIWPVGDALAVREGAE